eukprot:1162013-Pelagomonas_calceolata.AAC.6
MGMKITSMLSSTTTLIKTGLMQSQQLRSIHWETLPTSIKEKRMPRAKTPCIISTKRRKKDQSVLRKL